AGVVAADRGDPQSERRAVLILARRLEALATRDARLERGRVQQHLPDALRRRLERVTVLDLQRCTLLNSSPEVSRAARLARRAAPSSPRYSPPLPATAGCRASSAHTPPSAAWSWYRSTSAATRAASQPSRAAISQATGSAAA